jgi:hypothetical protein
MPETQAMIHLTTAPKILSTQTILSISKFKLIPKKPLQPVTMLKKIPGQNTG